MTEGNAICEVAGYRLVLLRFPAIYWESQRTLLVADVHLGKTAAFRAGGIPVPDCVDEDLDRLSAALSAVSAERLLVLGDLVHCQEGLTSELVDIVYRWRRMHGAVDMALVPGNHDRMDLETLHYWEITDLPAVHMEERFVFRHDPLDGLDVPAGHYLVSGHVHPAVRLNGSAHQSLRLPCFVVGRTRAILPAFGLFTGNGMFRPRRDDRIFVLAGESVREV